MKFEYKFVQFDVTALVAGGPEFLAQAQEQANLLGAEGWRLVWVERGQLAVFMRDVVPVPGGFTPT